MNLILSSGISKWETDHDIKLLFFVNLSFMLVHSSDMILRKCYENMKQTGSTIAKLLSWWSSDQVKTNIDGLLQRRVDIANMIKIMLDTYICHILQYSLIFLWGLFFKSQNAKHQTGVLLVPTPTIYLKNISSCLSCR